jgi:hypothetical protein
LEPGEVHASVVAIPQGGNFVRQIPLGRVALDRVMAADEIERADKAAVVPPIAQAAFDPTLAVAEELKQQIEDFHGFRGVMSVYDDASGTGWRAIVSPAVRFRRNLTLYRERGVPSACSGVYRYHRNSREPEIEFEGRLESSSSYPCEMGRFGSKYDRGGLAGLYGVRSCSAAVFASHRRERVSRWTLADGIRRI